MQDKNTLTVEDIAKVDNLVKEKLLSVGLHLDIKPSRSLHEALIVASMYDLNYSNMYYDDGEYCPNVTYGIFPIEEHGKEEALKLAILKCLYEFTLAT